ncbi:AraC family transcriptional regulator [Gorillibacterium sp. sgz5001074]|uniref:AraC family transcriptional regulator n=1 Tax=Gorillibacterium sp. sgz5001074 TaxID=3446695 RepID=UPI003F668F97
MEPAAKRPSGLLHHASRQDKMTLHLYHTTEERLEPYIEHYWIVRWDLRGREPYVSENLPHPSVHLVFEPEQSSVVGVLQEKFSRVLRDRSFVCGIKFRPGAFYPFVRQPVQRLTGLYTPVRQVFGPDIAEAEAAILTADSDDGMLRQAEAYLLAQLPPVRDEHLPLIRAIIEETRTDRTLTQVEPLAERFHLSPRVLQRLFLKYVGVSPKWVIRRYRLLEVADRLVQGAPPSWPDLAADLGYYDQSHFIRDFKSMVGHTPEEYIRMSTLPGTGTGTGTPAEATAEAEAGPAPTSLPQPSPPAS